jgi:thiol-disulfide isomerase/thioredoxin
MGKASRTKQDTDRRARIAAQREAQRRAEQRKRIYLAGGSILVVAIVVIALVLVKLNSGGGTAASSSNGPTGAALTTLTNQVTSVPSSVTEKVAGGGVDKAAFVSAETSAQVQNASQLGSYFGTVNGTPLTSGGKPEVLYLGAEYCPFCAAQRWAMVSALSRFGTFSGLTTTHSSSTDSDPNTPTFTFYKSTYKSDYITFTSVEEETNYRIGNSSDASVPYQTLQTPTADQQKTAQTYDPSGAIPFIDIANKYVQVGNLSPLNPSQLAGMSWSQVAAAMNNPSSAVGKAIIGNANYMTAAICNVTGNKPATACTPAIQKLEADLAS